MGTSVVVVFLRLFVTVVVVVVVVVVFVVVVDVVVVVVVVGLVRLVRGTVLNRMNNKSGEMEKIQKNP